MFKNECLNELRPLLFIKNVKVKLQNVHSELNKLFNVLYIFHDNVIY